MYEEFFGFEDEPFRLTPDPRYLYLSHKHAEALAHLRLGLTESSGFVCITGEVGTGKTTLLRAFLSELGSNVTAAYAFAPPLSALELLHRVCREFGLAVAGRSRGELVEELHAYLIAQHKAGRVCVLVLDEAQALSIELLEEIRLLLNLETETQKLLRIVLVGQPQLRRLLLNRELAQLNQRITLRWHLGRLRYRETAAYVAHRLAVASGGRAGGIFTRPAVRLLHSVSEGVPRLINMIAHRALLAAYLARATRVNRRLVARAYREIQAVPLPGTLSPTRRVALAAAGLTIGVALVLLGGPRLERLLQSPVPGATQATVPVHVPAGGDERLVAEVAAPLSKMLAAAPVIVPYAELARRLAGVGAEASARAATEAILEAWGERPLAADEASLPDGLESVAWRRGLQELVLTGNRSMLHLFDLPALVALRVPGAGAPRYVALTGMDETQAVISLDGEAASVEAAALDAMWAGPARVLWRDFDGLGPVMKRGARGVGVVRLQVLLRRAGVLAREPTGAFDADTERAVLDFQRSRQLVPDGLVGPLTRIVLYAEAGGYRRPALGGRARGAS